jgi:hypothetical protein
MQTTARCSYCRWYDPRGIACEGGMVYCNNPNGGSQSCFCVVLLDFQPIDGAAVFSRSFPFTIEVANVVPA